MPLHLAHLVFDLDTEIGSNPTEIGHSLAEHACDLRKFLRPQHDQGDKKNDDEMGDAEHASRCEPKPSLRASNQWVALIQAFPGRMKLYDCMIE
jgi:hypothetical protein